MSLKFNARRDCWLTVWIRFSASCFACCSPRTLGCLQNIVKNNLVSHILPDTMLLSWTGSKLDQTANHVYFREEYCNTHLLGHIKKVLGKWITRMCCNMLGKNYAGVCPIHRLASTMKMLKCWRVYLAWHKSVFVPPSSKTDALKNSSKSEAGPAWWDF